MRVRVRRTHTFHGVRQETTDKRDGPPAPVEAEPPQPFAAQTIRSLRPNSGTGHRPQDFPGTSMDGDLHELLDGHVKTSSARRGQKTRPQNKERQRRPGAVRWPVQGGGRWSPARCGAVVGWAGDAAEDACGASGRRGHGCRGCGAGRWVAGRQAEHPGRRRLPETLPTGPRSPKWSEWRQDSPGLPMMQATMGSCR